MELDNVAQSDKETGVRRMHRFSRQVAEKPASGVPDEVIAGTPSMYPSLVLGATWGNPRRPGIKGAYKRELGIAMGRWNAELRGRLTMQCMAPAPQTGMDEPQAFGASSMGSAHKRNPRAFFFRSGCQRE